MLLMFALTDTSRSPYARLQGADLNAVEWTGGFWAARFQQMQDVTVPHLFTLGEDPRAGTAVRNMRIAAGLEHGEFQGNDWSDEWLHKWIEAAATVWSKSRDPQLEVQMNAWIDLISRAQCADGYIATQTQLRGEPRYRDPRRHEGYVMGHLLTAACVHHGATGRSEYLEVARKCGRHLHERFTRHRTEMLHFPFNPSLVMGAVELFRLTRESVFVELAQTVIDLRGAAGRDRTNPKAHGDQTQDRVPLREEVEVVGHSVFWSYLYAGATDVYLELGDEELLQVLRRLWDDVVRTKLYITGGCSAVDIGKSMRDAASLRQLKLLDSAYFDRNPYWDRDDVHEAAGAAYQLPNASSYNETCGQIGLHLWSWRMLLATGEPKYAEIMERQMYNGFLSGIGLSGTEFSYSNALRSHGAGHGRRVQPVTERFPMATEHKTCCPTNLVRTIAQLHGYLYSWRVGELTVHHYGASRFANENLCVVQEADYPWSGELTFRFERTPSEPLTLRWRIPEWAAGATIAVNDEAAISVNPSTYVGQTRRWSTGDMVRMQLPLKARKLSAHPRVEEARNQVAVLRGPIVYCLESPDLPEDVRVEEVALPTNAELTPVLVEGLLGGYVALEGLGRHRPGPSGGELYREVDAGGAEREVPLRLIPYYAWCNRGVTEMSVWLPLA